MPASSSFTTSSGRLMSFFISVSSFKNCGVSFPIRLEWHHPFHRSGCSARSIGYSNGILADLFDSRLSDTTEFRLACYRTSTRDEIIGKCTENTSQEGSYKIDNQVRKVVCTTEQDLHKRRSKGTRGIESYIGNRAKGENLTGDHQADDKACPTGGRATIHSRSHNNQQEEEGANRLHGNGYNPTSARSVAA